MNCEKCVQLLSDFHDGKLKAKDQGLLEAHFNECVPCADTRQDLRSLISVAHELREVSLAPPNEKALWVRISNTLENIPERTTTEVDPFYIAAPAEPHSWWGSLTGKRWELSLPQLLTAVAAIVLAVTLLTVVSIRSIQGIQVEGEPLSIVHSSGTNASAITGMNLRFDPEDSLRQQQPTIDYWKQRVDQRKARWQPQMREAFDRNIKVIDQAVNDSLNELRSNPHDQVCEEMLNSALRDKMELLKEFSEL